MSWNKISKYLHCINSHISFISAIQSSNLVSIRSTYAQAEKKKKHKKTKQKKQNESFPIVTASC